ncbi:MAG: translocation/assembly module TamB domain-containing protein [Lysobacterales bacterium]
MSRRRILLLFLPALLILALAAALAWLMRSESGANWLWQRVVAAAPGALQARGVSGDLRSGLSLEQLSYRDTGLAVTADTVALRFDLDFWPPAVSVHHLIVGELRLESAAESAESETRAAEWLPRLALPVPVAFRRVEVGRVTLSSAAAEPWMELRKISLAANWQRELVLRNVALEHEGSPWQAELRFGFEPPHRLEATVTGSTVTPGRDEPGRADGGRRLMLRAQVSGDLERSRWSAAVEEPAVTLAGELRHLLTAPEWDAQLTAPFLDWPPGDALPALTLHDLVVSSSGTLTNYGLEAEARIGGHGLPTVDGRAVGAGDRSGLNLEVLHVAGEALAMEGTGRLEWAPSMNLRVDASVSRFNPQPWLDAWGAAEPASGRVQLTWHGGVLDFEVSAANAPGTVGALEASGAFDANSGAVSAELAWRDLVWPPGAAEPAVVSREGRATLGGNLDAWTVRGDLRVDGPDFPEGRLVANGTGGRDALSLQIPRGEVLGGGLSGALDVRWSPDVSWSASARLENIATGPLSPSFPGRVSGDLSVSSGPELGELRIDIQSLTGTVRDRPVRANGRLQLEAGRLAARGLTIGSGLSEVTADGQLYGPGGLTLEARIASLSDLADGASGSFEGSATVSLDPSHPLLRLDGSGAELTWGDTTVGKLTASTEVTGDHQVRLELIDLAFGDRRIDTLTVTSAGEVLERLQAELQFGENKASLVATGEVGDWGAPLQGGWRGQLEALRLEGPAVGQLALRQPAALSVGSDGLDVAESCLEGPLGGLLCVEAAWHPGSEQRLEASLDNVSPNLALGLLGSGFTVSQRLSGIVEWWQQPGSAPKARVRLDITPGELGVRGEEEAILTTAAGVFAFEIADGQLYSGNLDIPLAGAGGIDTDFSVPDVSLGLHAPVEGHLRVNLDSAEPLLRLVPGVEGASGPVTAELDFSGTLTNPRLTGYVSLVRGRLTHFTSGLLLEDIQLAGAVYEYDQTELSGTFRAGKGQGTIRTVVTFADLLRPEVLLEVSGDNLTLIDVPDLNLRADPDVSLTWRPGQLTINGRIAVPSARLSPRYLPTASATVSADVVIVAGEDPLAEPTNEPAPDTQIRGELELELGNDVELSLERATANISGTTKFVWKGPLVPVASGSFAVSGEINAYGQLLEVTEGRVNFSRRPADNPFLNIRAEREIYGSSQVRRAGVLVTGTLKEPVLEPYTTPMTTRERAMTMLVTGSDFSSEQGMGSVEVGMYVAPKLYISYGIGLFDEQNVISVRYDLGKGFGIKTTSGQRESGADISYTIEH